jgi:molecular chaperone HscB
LWNPWVFLQSEDATVSATDMDKQRQSTPVKCATCQGPMDSPLFCDHCRSLYPADGLNHFALFGLSPRYELDLVALRQKYLQLSRGIHPDFHGADDSSLSLHLSAQLNEAHRVLADPVLRAEYLLELCGGKSAKDDKRVPAEVLTTAIMWREDLQEAKATGDTATLQETAAQARAAYDETLTTIAKLARQLPADEEVRARLRMALNSVKYHQKLLAEL